MPIRPQRFRHQQVGVALPLDVTDADLTELGDPIEFLVRPSDDLLPSPGAALVTRITPQQAWRDGLIEAPADIKARVKEALEPRKQDTSERAGGAKRGGE